MDVNLKLVPKNVSAVTGCQFVTNGDTVTGFIASYDINYGNMGLPFAGDIWDELNATQKAQIQALYNKLMGFARAKVTEAAK